MTKIYQGLLVTAALTSWLVTSGLRFMAAQERLIYRPGPRDFTGSGDSPVETDGYVSHSPVLAEDGELVGLCRWAGA